MDDFQPLWDNQYSYSNNIVVKIHEDLDAGLGGTLFDGSVALAQYLDTIGRTKPELLVGKRCVELGAGTGLPGLLCSKLGAGHVLLTDIKSVVPLLQENIENNELLPTQVCAMALDWTTLDVDLARMKMNGYEQHSFDVILAADTIYQQQLVEPFLVACDALLKNDGMILFSHPRARVREASAFFFVRVLDWFDVEKVDAQQFCPGLALDSKQFKNPTEGVFVLKKKKKS